MFPQIRLLHLWIATVCLLHPAVGVNYPTNIACNAVNATALAITWTQASDTLVAGYHINLERTDGLIQESGFSIELNDRTYESYTFHGLGEYGTYGMTIHSYFSSGTNGTDYTLNCLTDPYYPDVANFNFTCWGISYTEITCTWENVTQAYWNGILEGYQLQYATYANGDYSYVNLTLADEIYTVSGLTFDTWYVLHIRTFNQFGLSPYASFGAKTLGFPVVNETLTRYFCYEAVPGTLEFSWYEMPCTVYVGTILALLLLTIILTCICCCQCCCGGKKANSNTEINIFNEENNNEYYEKNQETDDEETDEDDENDEESNTESSGNEDQDTDREQEQSVTTSKENQENKTETLHNKDIDDDTDPESSNDSLSDSDDLNVNVSNEKKQASVIGSRIKKTKKIKQKPKQMRKKEDKSTTEPAVLSVIDENKSSKVDNKKVTSDKKDNRKAKRRSTNHSDDDDSDTDSTAYYEDWNPDAEENPDINVTKVLVDNAQKEDSISSCKTKYAKPNSKGKQSSRRKAKRKEKIGSNTKVEEINRSVSKLRKEEDDDDTGSDSNYSDTSGDGETPSENDSNNENDKPFGNMSDNDDESGKKISHKSKKTEGGDNLFKLKSQSMEDNSRGTKPARVETENWIDDDSFNAQNKHKDAKKVMLVGSLSNSSQIEAGTKSNGEYFNNTTDQHVGFTKTTKYNVPICDDWDEDIDDSRTNANNSDTIVVGIAPHVSSKVTGNNNQNNKGTMYVNNDNERGTHLMNDNHQWIGTPHNDTTENNMLINQHLPTTLVKANENHFPPDEQNHMSKLNKQLLPNSNLQWQSERHPNNLNRICTPPGYGRNLDSTFYRLPGNTQTDIPHGFRRNPDGTIYLLPQRHNNATVSKYGDNAIDSEGGNVSFPIHKSNENGTNSVKKDMSHNDLRFGFDQSQGGLMHKQNSNLTPGHGIAHTGNINTLSDDNDTRAKNGFVNNPGGAIRNKNKWQSHHGNTNGTNSNSHQDSNNGGIGSSVHAKSNHSYNGTSYGQLKVNGEELDNQSENQDNRHKFDSLFKSASKQKAAKASRIGASRNNGKATAKKGNSKNDFMNDFQDYGDGDNLFATQTNNASNGYQMNTNDKLMYQNVGFKDATQLQLTDESYHQPGLQNGRTSQSQPHSTTVRFNVDSIEENALPSSSFQNPNTSQPLNQQKHSQRDVRDSNISAIGQTNFRHQPRNQNGENSISNVSSHVLRQKTKDAVSPKPTDGRKSLVSFRNGNNGANDRSVHPIIPDTPRQFKKLPSDDPTKSVGDHMNRVPLQSTQARSTEKAKNNAWVDNGRKQDRKGRQSGTKTPVKELKKMEMPQQKEAEPVFETDRLGKKFPFLRLPEKDETRVIDGHNDRRRSLPGNKALDATSNGKKDTLNKSLGSGMHKNVSDSTLVLRGRDFVPMENAAHKYVPSIPNTLPQDKNSSIGIQPETRDKIFYGFGVGKWRLMAAKWLNKWKMKKRPVKTAKSSWD